MFEVEIKRDGVSIFKIIVTRCGRALSAVCLQGGRASGDMHMKQLLMTPEENKPMATDQEWARELLETYGADVWKKRSE
jgi:hypothetical protein